MAKKRPIDKNDAMELDASNKNSSKYQVEIIRNSAIYAKKTISYLLKLYYLVFWKNYLKKENIWEFYSAV